MVEGQPLLSTLMQILAKTKAPNGLQQALLLALLGRELSELGVVSCPWRTLFLDIGGVFRHLVVPLCISFQKNLSRWRLGLGKASDRGPLLEGHPGL